jgi:hypothetical protein
VLSVNQQQYCGDESEEVVREMERMLELTQEMLASAHDGDWEHVVRLWEIRFPTLKLIFSVPIPKEIVVQVGGILQEIYGLEQEILKLGEENRTLISQKLSELQQGKAASHFYNGVLA